MPAKKPSKKNTTKDRITVRMYDVGFGDCFLVTIPTSKGDRRILFDCGSVKKGTRNMDDVVDMLIADVTEKGVPRIDVVVCTHRHKDHIAGFEHPKWSDVEVGEVWLPWTESDEPEAIRIREAQLRLAAALDAALDKSASLALTPERKAFYNDARELTLNATGNENAMMTLHEGFKARREVTRRFLPEKDKDGNILDTLTTELLPGVTIHVLGPSRDENVIRDMDPPPGKSYMQLVSSTDAGSDAPEPFHTDWWVDKKDETVVIDAKDKERIKDYSDGFSAAVAAALDSAVNGTSLMLILQFRDTYLLFPGDAQWGTWQVAMENKKFRRMMERIAFYKIGHHGSHNATPKPFVKEILGKNVISMASTYPMTKWPHIPLPELMNDLIDHGPVIRSDQTAAAPAAFSVGQGDRAGIIETFIRI
ncbi:MAG TPA: MBL fold metallo-hydrolase [Thermoanaerobaculia bacterium]|nr:MBL fold metallo-hydrolase [Thermoanaerobaculia bacterium]